MPPLRYRFEQSPLIRLAFEAVINILVRTSTGRLKRSGDRGSMTRANSTNVLDEGLRIGETGRRMNSMVK
jgi:hypothetical protein